MSERPDKTAQAEMLKAGGDQSEARPEPAPKPVAGFKTAAEILPSVLAEIARGRDPWGRR